MKAILLYKDFVFWKKNTIFYEGNFALQDFSILSKNTKIYEGNIALQGFLFLEKNMDLESTGFGEMKDNELK